MKAEYFKNKDLEGTPAFATYSDDGARLWVNGRLLIDDWKLGRAADMPGKITLKAGKVPRGSYFDIGHSIFL